MIVDDSLFMRALVRHIVEKIGYRVCYESMSGQDAVTAYAEHAPDVVLLDYTLPDINGVETAKHILQSHPRAKIIMVSALATDYVLKDAVDAGVRGFVAKPFTVDTIERQLNLVVGPIA